MEKKINFEEITLRCEVSHRGGGVEIDLTSLGFPNEKMAAYQNYLGGGMLGRVCVNDTLDSYDSLSETEKEKITEIGEALKQYYFGLTNPEEGSWEHQSYLRNQNMPISAY